MMQILAPCLHFGHHTKDVTVFLHDGISNLDRMTCNEALSTPLLFLHNHVDPKAVVFLKAKLEQCASSRHLVIFLWFAGFAEEDKVFVTFTRCSSNAIPLRERPEYSPFHLPSQGYLIRSEEGSPLVSI